MAGGLGLLHPRTRRLAAWGLIALLVAVFPANIYLYQHQEIFPQVSPLLHLLRLPLQLVFIAWAYYAAGLGVRRCLFKPVRPEDLDTARGDLPAHPGARPEAW